MNCIGNLYGMEVYLDANLVEKYTKFTRKQIRKFKNTRWVKKYLKKYSYEATKPSMNIIEGHGKMIMHPLMWKAIEEKTNDIKIQRNDRQGECIIPTFGMGRRPFGSQPY